MADMELVSEQLKALENVIGSYLAPSGFALISPFADRHGVSETRFARIQGEITYFISIACDPKSDGESWLCQFSGGASYRQESSREVVSTIEFRPTAVQLHVLKRSLTSAIKKAEQQGARLQANVSSLQLNIFPTVKTVAEAIERPLQNA